MTNPLLHPLFRRATLLLCCLVALRLWYSHMLADQEKWLQSGCQNQMKGIYLTICQYAKDYDGKFPPAKIGGARGDGREYHTSAVLPTGWADALLPYSNSSAIFYCPSDTEVQSDKPTEPRYIDFWMNGLASGIATASVASPASTILFGEGEDGKDDADATYSKKQLPPAWILDTSSPAYRHRGKANYVMADGSAHWIEAHAVMTFGGRKNSFLIR